jgi:PadR family transcriptional regulator PadR
VPGPPRVTNPLLDVLEVLISALGSDSDLHGWAIMKAAKRSGPTVYGVIDRLEDMGWITGQWEAQNPEPNKPRRRFYRLTPTGRVEATELLLKHRPQSLGRVTGLKPGLALPPWPDGLPRGGTA